MTADRARDLTDAFVSIANTMVEGGDVVDSLSVLTGDCARLLDIDSAGLLIADSRGVLQLVAVSSEQARILELFQLQRDEGPCRDCFHSGDPVTVPDVRLETGRWPQFAPAATTAGFVSVHALPMRLRDKRLGTLGLFGTAPGLLDDEDLRLGQALAHVASIAIVAQKAATNIATINEQLKAALTSRIVIEQAKGLVGQLSGLEMDQAFAVILRYARDHNLRLTGVAEALVARSLTVAEVLHHGASKDVPRGGPS
jgi:GAF domain-containing protein